MAVPLPSIHFSAVAAGCFPKERLRLLETILAVCDQDNNTSYPRRGLTALTAFNIYPGTFVTTAAPDRLLRSLISMLGFSVREFSALKEGERMFFAIYPSYSTNKSYIGLSDLKKYFKCNKDIWTGSRSHYMPFIEAAHAFVLDGGRNGIILHACLSPKEVEEIRRLGFSVERVETVPAYFEELASGLVDQSAASDLELTA